MSETINGRYVLKNEIGSGGMGAVFRAHDRLTDETVALKQVRLNAEPQIIDSLSSHDTQEQLRLVLAKEFQILAGLRHPNIISVIDYGFDSEQQPFYTMTFLEGGQTILEAGAGLDQNGKLDLIEQLLQGLAYLHRRGILHRDIKPENVLVMDGVVKLLDFGLSQKIDEEGAIGGSPLYMAPELIEGEEPTVAADLYAVGVLLSQLLSGDHPFGQFNNRFYRRVLTAKPNLAKLNESLHPLITLLLGKNRNRRPQSAQEVLLLLAKAVDRPLPAETAHIRESFLQAAQFVGREAELGRLTSALEAAKAGQGSAWLIGGESGVGKSRLIHELETVALVQGFQLLRGQGAEKGSGLPFNLWREPLRYLIKTNNETSDLTAAVLQPLIPDISKLLGRPIEPAPELDEKASKMRLFSTIARLFLDLERPLLLVLEDLHWTAESLKVIPYLTRQIDHHQLVIIGSHRSDDKPKLADDLPEMTYLQLSRLDENEMACLSMAMLGQAGKNKEIAALLQRETEGNTFFVVEVVRALAEEAGSLDQIGQMELPATLLPQGIQDIVHRRVDKLPATAKELLIKSAAAGRVLDMPLVEKLGSSLQVDVEAVWLPLCADYALLEVQNGSWQFVHGKIRDGLLASLSPAQERILHNEVAQEIEAIYVDDEGQAARLAYHWRKAENREKEWVHAQIAGRQAAAQFAHRDVIFYLERVLTLTQDDDLETRFKLYQGCIEAYTSLGESEKQQEILGHLTDIAERLNDAAKRLTVLNLEGAIHMVAGDFENAKTVFLQLVDEARTNHLIVDEVSGLINLAKAYGTQREAEEGENIIEMARPLVAEIEDVELLLRWHNTIALMHYFAGNIREGFQPLNDTLRLSQAHGLIKNEKIALGNLGSFHDALGEYEEAERNYEEALNRSRRMGDLYGESALLGNIALLHLSLGDAEKSVDLIKEALRLNRQIANWGGITYNLNSLGIAYHQIGDYKKGKQYFDEAIIQKQELNLAWSEAFSWNMLGHLLIDTKELEEGLVAFQTAERLQVDLSFSITLVETWAGLAAAHSLLGHLGEATDYGERVWEHLEKDGFKGDWEWAISVLHLFQAFRVLKDPRATDIVRLAFEELERRTLGISTDASREKFLTQVPANRKLIELYQLLVQSSEAALSTS